MNASLEEYIASAAGIDADGHPIEQPQDFTEILAKRKFNPAIEPPPLRPIYTLAGNAISTPGNLTSVTSTIKTGKSAVVGAMAASVMTESRNADTLGFTSNNPKGFALLHFDSEQSPDDHWHLVMRILKRAGLREPPGWFLSYCLTGLGFKVSAECVRQAISQAADKFSGIHSILIDGWADLVADVNDPEECNAFVAEQHNTAIQYDCPIIGVIHFNPGGEKTRGHLGSQLERKAETNLRLDKESETTTVWSDKQRRAPIPKGKGPCFQWSTEADMHVSVETRQSVADREQIDTLSLLAEDLFSERPSMHWCDLVTTAKKRLAVSDRTAARRIADMARLGVIKKFGLGLWTKGT